MEIISEGVPAEAALPRFPDGCIDLQELIRRLAEQVANGIMATEADQLCEATGNSRNGYRERSLKTCVGDLTLPFGSKGNCWRKTAETPLAEKIKLITAIQAKRMKAV